MARRLTHRQLRALSESIQRLYSATELQSFPQQVFRALAPLLRCDNFAYNELRSDGVPVRLHCEPELPSEATAYFYSLGAQFAREHPGISHVTQTGSTEPVKITDFVSQRQWRRGRLYNEFFHPVGCDYQLAFISPARGGKVGLAFNRAMRDFSEADRQLVRLITPHLVQAHANAQAFTGLRHALSSAHAAWLVIAPDRRIDYGTPEAIQWLEKYFASSVSSALPLPLSRWLTSAETLSHTVVPLVVDTSEGVLTVTLLERDWTGCYRLSLQETNYAVAMEKLIERGLTRREAEVLTWVTRGKTDGEIAVILAVKRVTISKHLQHVYEKLGVENRTTAAASAAELIVRCS